MEPFERNPSGWTDVRTDGRTRANSLSRSKNQKNGQKKGKKWLFFGPGGPNFGPFSQLFANHF